MNTFLFTAKQNVSRRGFALVFTVLIVSLILALAMTIADISYRQALLSNLARDSQVAFYQADAGLDCGMYYDFTLNAFPKYSTSKDYVPPDTSKPLTCGKQTLLYDASQSARDHYVYIPQNVTGPCFTITFDKTDSFKKVVEGDGYNLCGAPNPRQVQRTLTLTY